MRKLSSLLNLNHLLFDSDHSLKRRTQLTTLVVLLSGIFAGARLSFAFPIQPPQDHPPARLPQPALSSNSLGVGQVLKAIPPAPPQIIPHITRTESLVLHRPFQVGAFVEAKISSLRLANSIGHDLELKNGHLVWGRLKTQHGRQFLIVSWSYKNSAFAALTTLTGQQHSDAPTLTLHIAPARFVFEDTDATTRARANSGLVSSQDGGSTSAWHPAVSVFSVSVTRLIVAQWGFVVSDLFSGPFLAASESQTIGILTGHASILHQSN